MPDILLGRIAELEDNRNWELMPLDKNGLGKEKVSLGSEPGQEWVKCWISVLSGLHRWLKGEHLGSFGISDKTAVRFSIVNMS